MNDLFDSIEHRIGATSVPKFDFVTVRLKAEQKPRRERRRRNLTARVAFFIVAPMVAAAAAHFVPLQVTHRYGNWQLYGPGKGETVLHPTPAMFARLSRRAPYPVVWPSGLPHGHKAYMLGSVGSEVFIVVYSCGGQDLDRVSNISLHSSQAVIIPKNYSAVNPKLGNWFTSQSQDHSQNLLWDVGSQSVLFGSDCLTQQQIAHVRAATIAEADARRYR